MMTRAAWVGLAMGLAALAAIYWLVYGPEDTLAPPAPPPVAVAEDAVPTPELTAGEAPIQHPLPAPVAEPQGQTRTPLPELEDSDEAVSAELRTLFGAEPVDALLVPREFIRRFVLVVDSLDREEPLPLWLRPVRRAPGSFTVDAQADALALSPRNAQRYAAHIALLESVDMAALAATYRRYYPLFQDAYDRLGNPRRRYFNDRFVEIIDHLLATPVVSEPIALARPKVVYLFADPELERLSAGQKLMLRIGRDNAARVQARLRELRSAIASR